MSDGEPKPRRPVCEFYSDAEFDDMVARALQYAETPREREFAVSMSARWSRFGSLTLVTERQLDWLFYLAKYT